MTPGNYDFTIYQGQTFVRELEILDTTMQNVDLSGYEAKMQIRDAKDTNSPLVATLHSDLSQILSSTGAVGGTFTLSFGTNLGTFVTTDIPFNATSLQVKNALELLPNIGFGNIATTGGPLPQIPINISFVGPFLHKNQPLLVCDDSKLSGDPINVTHQVIGVSPQNSTQSLSITGAIGGTFTLTYKGQTTNPLLYNATNSAIQTALQSLTNISAGNINVTGGPLPTQPISISFINALGQSPQPLLSCYDDLLLGGPVSITMTQAGISPQNEKQTISCTGSAGTFRLNFRGADTPILAYSASKDDVLSVLSAINTIHTGNIATTGGPLPNTPIVVEFINDMKWSKQPLIMGSYINFTGGSIAASQPTSGVTPRNAIQSIQGSAGNTSFTLTVPSPVNQTTGTIPANATASQIETALRALSLISDTSGVDIVVTGGPIGTNPVLVTFKDSLGNRAIANMTVTGGTNVTVNSTATGTQIGTSGNSAIQTLSLTNSDGGSFTLSFTNPFSPYGINKTGILPWNANAAAIQVALQNLPGIAFTHFSPSGSPQTPNVVVTDNNAGGTGTSNISNSVITITFGGTLANMPVSQISPTDQNFTKGTVSVTESQSGINPVSAIQKITQGPTRKGTFTLTYNSSTTGPIPYNASANDITNALKSINIYDVSVVGGPLKTNPSDNDNPIIINFINSLSSQPVPLFTANSSTLVGGPATISSTIIGVTPVNEKQLLTAGAVTNGVFTITFNGQKTGNLNYNASSGEIQTALNLLPGVSNASILVSPIVSTTANRIDVTPMVVSFVNNLGNTPQPLMTIDSSLLTNQTAVVVKPPNDGIILIDPVNAILTLKMFADKTTTFSGWSGSKYYDLKLIAPNGDVERLFQGKVSLDQQVTSDEPYVGSPQPQFLAHPLSLFVPEEKTSLLRTRYRNG